MRNKNYIRSVVLVSSLSFAVSALGELSDPRTRDEDLSATTLSMGVEVNGAGLYVYTYGLQAGTENTGMVSEFAIDISCAEEPDQKGFSASDFPTNSLASASSDGKHVPVALDAPVGQSFQTGVAASNEAMWSVMLKPAEGASGLTIISPYPPGARNYALYPGVDYNMSLYDYEGLDSDDPTVPWIDDWTVRGVTTGPACPGQEYPPGGGGDAFEGSFESSESGDTNALLTYSSPTVDHLTLEEGKTSLEMTINYGANIDAKTFRVSPARNKLSSLFHPQPGSSETVTIPFDVGKNRIEIQVHAVSALGKDRKVDGALTKKAGLILDRDVFVFRVPGGSGKGAPK